MRFAPAPMVSVTSWLSVGFWRSPTPGMMRVPGVWRSLRMTVCRKFWPNTEISTEAGWFWRSLFQTSIHASARCSSGSGRTKEVGEVQRCARLDEHVLIDPEARRAMTPAQFRIVPAEVGGGVQFVAFLVLAPGGVAHVDRVVLDLHQQDVLAFAHCRRALELERREEALVRADVVAVDEDVRLVVHRAEAHEHRALVEHRARDGERGPVDTPPRGRSARRNAAPTPSTPAPRC